MSNVAGAPAQAKTPLYEAPDVEDIRHTDDLGSSVGEMATSQYERADALTDGFRQAGDAIGGNPLTAIGIGVGLGLPIRPCDWRPQQASVLARTMNPLVQSGCLAALVATALTLPAFATPEGVATGSTSIERPSSTWEVSGSGMKLPPDRLGARTALEPHIGMRFSSGANVFHFHSH